MRSPCLLIFYFILQRKELCEASTTDSQALGEEIACLQLMLSTKRLTPSPGLSAPVKQEPKHFTKHEETWHEVRHLLPFGVGDKLALTHSVSGLGKSLSSIRFSGTLLWLGE